MFWVYLSLSGVHVIEPKFLTCSKFVNPITLVKSNKITNVFYAISCICIFWVKQYFLRLNLCIENHISLSLARFVSFLMRFFSS